MFNLKLKAKNVSERIKAGFMKKKKGLDGFVVVIIIIIIAVAVGLLFRDQLATFFKDMMANLTAQSNILISTPNP